jgi:hypothetical protein
MEFQREFQLKRDRVEIRTQAEERTMVLQKLPLAWKRQVINEETKRGKGKLMVRITNVSGKPLLIIQHLLQVAVGELVGTIRETTNGILVECPNSQVQQKLLDMDRWTLEGKVIKTCRVEETMSGDEMMDFIAERLLGQEKLNAINQSMGTLIDREVHQVGKGNNRPNQQSKGKGYNRRYEPEPKPDKPTSPPPPTNSSRQPTSPRNSPRESRPADHRGRGKGDWGDRRDDWAKPCNHCKVAGRDSWHDYRGCDYHKKWLATKFSGKGQGPPSPRRSSPQAHSSEPKPTSSGEQSSR